MVGIDVLEPERLARALERTPALRERLFTPGELAYAEGRARPHRHLAARFCAKEAVFKALGLCAFAPLEIEVLGGGADTGVSLHGDASARANALDVTVQISLTHLAGVAAAVAVAVPGETGAAVGEL